MRYADSLASSLDFAQVVGVPPDHYRLICLIHRRARRRRFADVGPIGHHIMTKP